KSVLSAVSTYSTAHLPDLLSFPTRRSSDLVKLPGRVAQLPAEPRRAAHEAALEHDPGAEAGPGRQHHQRAGAPAGTGFGAGIVRSEEHTSELQSCGHIVCRLLLEKKKNKAH